MTPPGAWPALRPPLPPSVRRLGTAPGRAESPDSSAHLDFVRHDRKRRRLHHRMLSELLGVVSARLPPQDEAAPMNYQTKVPHPPEQPGLHLRLQLFHLRDP